jgi:uncharacterized membrane protein
MDPEHLSRAVREASDSSMRLRRGIIGLSLAAAGSMGLIALYQSGVIRHIPEPPLPALNADKVDASAEAFERFAVGDGFLGFVSYGVTMTLAAMGPPDRATRQPWIPLVLAAKVAFDVATASKLTVDQWTKHKAFCFWCLIAATATFATAPLVVDETRRALAAVSARRALQNVDTDDGYI